MSRLSLRFGCSWAVVFALATQVHAITINTVPVGNPGNAPDVHGVGFGSVAYNYRIGTTEVTNAQYAEFLNGVDPNGTNMLGLYASSMSIDALGGINFKGGAANGSKYKVRLGRENNPVVWVTWYDSIRFANWLHNGQGSGDTENGAYTILGGTPVPSNGRSITRNAGAQWWLPSEDEWYKAAYHKNDGATGNYWDYPTSTNAIPYSDQPSGSDAPTQSNTANFNQSDLLANGYDDGYAATGSTLGSNGLNYLTDVGAYTLSASPYGTFDQGGNVYEWNEALLSPPFRSLRGGSWFNGSSNLHASFRFLDGTTNQKGIIGFRVASIPEPGTMCLAALGAVGMLLRRRARY